MKERKEPEFITFGDGEEVTGILLTIERIRVKDKPVSRYTVIEEESGELKAFLGTFQIDSKLRTGDALHRIRVRCEGSDPSITRNGKALKLFKVYVSQFKVNDALREASEFGITDAEIPF